MILTFHKYTTWCSHALNPHCGASFFSSDPALIWFFEDCRVLIEKSLHLPLNYDFKETLILIKYQRYQIMRWQDPN